MQEAGRAHGFVHAFEHELDLALKGAPRSRDTYSANVFEKTHRAEDRKTHR